MRRRVASWAKCFLAQAVLTSANMVSYAMQSEPRYRCERRALGNHVVSQLGAETRKLRIKVALIDYLMKTQVEPAVCGTLVLGGSTFARSGRGRKHPIAGESKAGALDAKCNILAASLWGML